ncbi:MAG: 3-dehydroquinate synthase [Nitrospiraceae bacterium]
MKVSLGERSYDISIQNGLIREVGPRLARLGLTGKAIVVTDRNVAPRYLRPVMRSLKAEGYENYSIVLSAGEQFKTVRSLTNILDKLVQVGCERRSVVIALGGGVVGDLAGFAAATYLRGIPYVQVPTTLVAQVDSSVGGKTGVNHSLGKNLIGAFHQPRAVLIDPDILRTLPKREWIAGLAEVIKYGVIEDETFFSYLERQMSAILALAPDVMTRIIKRSCEIKAVVVGEDERESGRRRILNFGHTIGHALESLGYYRTLIHGEAVAIGMVQEAELARHLGLCGQDVADRIGALIRAAGLRDQLPPVTFAALWGVMQHDKKIVDGRIYGVWPERIGKVVTAPLDREICRRWFQSLRQPVRIDRRPRMFRQVKNVRLYSKERQPSPSSKRRGRPHGN